MKKFARSSKKQLAVADTRGEKERKPKLITERIESTPQLDNLQHSSEPEGRYLVFGKQSDKWWTDANIPLFPGQSVVDHTYPAISDG